MTQQLKSGKNGNLQTVQMMRQVAQARAGDPLVRRLALSILNQEKIPSHYYLEEAGAMGRYVQSAVRYVRDPTGIEQLTDPVLMIKMIQKGVAQGDCDDMALLVATLLLSIGHHPKFVMVRFRGGSRDPYHHIYVVDYEKNGDRPGPKNRIVLDAIIKDRPIGYEVPHLSGDEIDV